VASSQLPSGSPRTDRPRPPSQLRPAFQPEPWQSAAKVSGFCWEEALSEQSASTVSAEAPVARAQADPVDLAARRPAADLDDPLLRVGYEEWAFHLLALGSEAPAPW
jgi:hypothetical protein